MREKERRVSCWVNFSQQKGWWFDLTIRGVVEMKKRGRRKVVLNKEDIAEDWCFMCKDGGTLLICDYKQCLKAYHSNCVDKDDSFLTSESQWTCNWHCCHLCRKASTFRCYCCPHAVCRHCIHGSEFVHVKGKYGLCNHCLKLALLVEENMNVDSDGETVDLKNRETYEGLFKEYYEIIKEKIGLNIKVLCAAKCRLRKGLNYPHNSDSDAYDEDEDNDSVSDYESMDDSDAQDSWHRKKGSKRKQSLNERKRTSCKKLFVGWGSMSLIQFLSSIGKDTSQKLTQQEVTNIIAEYVREHKLFHPKKKRKIICDASLRSLLGRKIVNKNSIKNLLEAHFAENQEESEEDEVEYSSQEDEDRLVACKRQTVKKMEEESPKHERASSVTQSEFAAIVTENIKLVYLKKSLVYELCKKPESLGDKVTGSFIRVKADPYDAFQKNSHQLMQVTGMKKVSIGAENAELLLLVSEMPKEIDMSMLSNDDFTEEECEDLRSRVKAGLVKKPRVVELERMARNLHKDITKHWISRELDLLQRLIDRANEKGWRRELFGYMERKQLLQTSAEQERLLGNIPRVIPEVVESEPVYEDIEDENDQGRSPISTLFSVSDDTWEGNRSSSGQNSALLHKESQLSLSEEDQNVIRSCNEEQPEQFHGPSPENQSNITLQSEADICTYVAGTKRNLGTNVEKATPKDQAAVIAESNNLSSDDSDNISRIIVNKQNPEDPNSSVWHISGTDGDKTAKYSLSLLKRWSESSSYAMKVKVWKENQCEDSAIWLTDAIKLAFPGG